MSLASRLAERPAPSAVIAKTYGTNVPESFRQGEIAAQMTPALPFSPGQPIGPFDGYDRFPRSFNFETAYNIATRPRTHEAVSFQVLQGLVRSYDVAQIAIWHRIDSIRSLKWKLLSAEHYFGDVTDAIPLGLAALRKPDRRRFLKTWLAMYLYDILAYDAGTLYRIRNRAGRAIGLKVVSGPTVAPLLDYWGDSPESPAEAYVQYVNGLPWGWLTRDDVIYEPFRPQADSPYGSPPVETVILNANTDLRFQVYFLQRFTEGNLPAAFASSPDTWSPDQIEQWQGYWDAMMYGDQSRKHQIRWMPGGSKIMWSSEKDFSDVFSLFMMRKTLAAYHVVPADVGFTENVNRSSGESQADVQHRVGDLPLMEHVEGILSAFLLDDLGLPLRFEFDRGEEQVDQLAQAQADQAYMDRAVVSASEIREMRYGLTDTRPVPRVFFTERAGAVPLNSLLALAGEIDPQTAAPAEGAALPHQVFTEAPGVVPNPPLYSQPLAEEIYGPKAIPAHTETASTMPVAKDGEAAPGITSETGIYSYDLEGRDEDEEPDNAASVAKEMAAFRRYSRSRLRSVSWRDFRFDAVAAGEARRLNAEGRAAIAKDGTPGLSPRSGMISLDLPPGTISPVPGGVDDHHVTVVYLGPDVSDDDFAAACQRAAAAAAAMPGPLGAEIGGIGSFPPSDSSDGKVPAWAGVVAPGSERLREALQDLSASEHAGWKPHVTLAYVEPGDPLPAPVSCTQVTFTHLSVHRGDDVARFPLGAPPVPDCCGGECCQGDGGCCGGSGGCTCGPSGSDGGTPSDGDESVCPCGTPVVYDEMNGWQHADGSVSHDDGESVSDKMASVAKAAITPGGEGSGQPGGPKAPDGRKWPGWKLDLKAVAYWAPLLAAALAGALTKADAERIAEAYIRDHPAGEQGSQGKRDAVEAATAWLAGQGVDLVPVIAPLVPGMLADAQMIGGACAAAMVSGGSPDLAGWQPGDQDTAQQQAEALGLGAGLSSAPAQAGETASQMAAGYMTVLARALVDGAASGLGAAAIGASLLDALSDPDQASGSMLGRLVTGIAAAAKALYLKLKVQRVRWQTDPASNVCPECLANQAGGPYKIANAPECPAHIKCRCAVVPA